MRLAVAQILISSGKLYAETRALTFRKGDFAMSPSMIEWRPTSAYLYLLHLNANGLAWEYLRRNPAYRKDFERFHRTRDGVFQTRWGLQFRLQPGRGRPRSDADMDQH